jgi:MFS family permease
VSATTITASPGLRSLLRVPGVAWLLGAALVGRLPAATLGLLCVLRTRELTGSLGLAGAVAGVYAVATGATMPLLGRLVDRRGQRPVLLACTAVASAGIAGLALLPHGTGAAPLVLCALVTGAALRLPLARVLGGAALAGLPSLATVLIGVHWLGTPVGIALFAWWCGRLAARRRPAGPVPAVA